MKSIWSIQKESLCVNISRKSWSSVGTFRAYKSMHYLVSTYRYLGNRWLIFIGNIIIPFCYFRLELQTFLRIYVFPLCADPGCVSILCQLPYLLWYARLPSNSGFPTVIEETMCWTRASDRCVVKVRAGVHGRALSVQYCTITCAECKWKSIYNELIESQECYFPIQTLLLWWHNWLNSGFMAKDYKLDVSEGYCSCRRRGGNFYMA